jgi:hypothetical protein
MLLFYPLRNGKSPLANGGKFPQIFLFRDLSKCRKEHYCNLANHFARVCCVPIGGKNREVLCITIGLCMLVGNILFFRSSFFKVVRHHA